MRRLLTAAAAAVLACKTAAPARPAPTPAEPKTVAAKEVAHAEAQAGSGGAPPLATVDDTAVVAMQGPGFDQLGKRDRLLAYWLSQAARAGDAIAWDQGYRHTLEVVRLLRGILSKPESVPEALLPKLRLYARRLYLNRGLHDAATEAKVLPPFDVESLRSAALAAQAAGADLGLGGAKLDPALRSLEGAIFDPKVDPVRTSRAPGEDPLRSSSINLYSGVSLADLRGFVEEYPANSRLVKEQGRLVEQVYRADLPGLHASRLEKAANALETAAAFADSAQREALLKLSRALRSGSARDAQAAQEASAPLLPKVDALIGFLGGNADPRGVKALWLGLVGFRDEERSAPLRRLAAEIGWFELRAPWPQEFKRRELALPAAEALVVASAAGGARPEPFLGLQLVPGQRGRAPGKAVLVPGLDDAAALARDVRATAELAPAQGVAELIRCRAQLRYAAAAVHEVIGHAGAAPSALSGEHAAILEEAGAEVLAHFHMQDPKLVELGLISDPKCQPLWPQLAAVGWLTSLALVPDGDRLDSVELRADQLQLWWFTQRHAVIVSKTDGKTVLSVPDAGAFHKAAGNLLSMLRTIQATGDAALLRGLVDAHAARLDPALRDEVVARFDAAGIPRRVAALPPNVRAVVDGGHVIDARIEPVKDLDAQILEDWAEF